MAVANFFRNAGFYIGLSFEKVSFLFCLPSSVVYIVRVLKSKLSEGADALVSL